MFNKDSLAEYYCVFSRTSLNQSLRSDNTYVFGELAYINNLRNSIAHHRPIPTEIPLP